MPSEISRSDAPKLLTFPRNIQQHNQHDTNYEVTTAHADYSIYRNPVL
jgi:hypothetical protein